MSDENLIVTDKWGKTGFAEIMVVHMEISAEN